MTLVELQQQVLELSEEERAVLAGMLFKSLDPDHQDALRGQLDVVDESAMEALGERLEARMKAWFEEGKGREWTADDWARLKRGEYRHPPDPKSFAVPPGWRSPRYDEG